MQRPEILRNSSLMDISDAVFISSLPHRQSFFEKGGWLRCSGPDDSEWRQFLKKNFSDIDIRYAENEAARYKKIGAAPGNKKDVFDTNVVHIWQDSYPLNLKQIFDPPPVLFYCGENPGKIIDGSYNKIAIVGTREPAPITLAAIDEYLTQIGTLRENSVIISGLARGVDAYAHRSALKKKIPGIAVLGAGLNHAGPASSRDIPKRYWNAGVPFSLISEFAPHIRGYAGNFPRRNRIIAGLSDTVGIMQAPYKSGAMITARYALDEGRDVAAFDHSLLYPPGFNEGARSLIESGATFLKFFSLEKNLIYNFSSSSREGEKQLEFWEKKQSGNILWLGDNIYLDRSADTEE